MSSGEACAYAENDGSATVVLLRDGVGIEATYTSSEPEDPCWYGDWLIPQLTQVKVTKPVWELESRMWWLPIRFT